MKHRPRIILLLVIGSLLLSQAAVSSVVYVTTTGNDLNDGSSWLSAKRNVQAGMDRANPGDQVWVAAGTYTERIKLKRSLKLYGGFPAQGGMWASRDINTNQTILDGGQAGTVVTAPYGADRDTCIDGFNIRNGRSDAGGGIYCFNSSPTISNNSIRQNMATGYNGLGGGICCESSSPLIENNLIEQNSAVSGSAVYCSDNSNPTISGNTVSSNIVSPALYCADYSNPTVTGNTITGNPGGIVCDWDSSPQILSNTINQNSSSSGGGILCLYSGPTISGNELKLNSSSDCGGAITCDSSSPQINANNIETNSAVRGAGIFCGYGSSPGILENTIKGNTGISAGAYGGGINSDNSSPTITGNRISGNTAFYGGGIFNGYGASPYILNNIIYSNASTSSGGGIRSNSSSPFIINNTIVSNSGGGIMFNASPATVVNNIVCYNSSGMLKDVSSTQYPVLRNNCVSNNTVHNYYNVSAGVGDISVTPQFIDMTNADYHLSPLSPCINAGTASYAVLPTKDIDGEARIWAVVVDIGADEFKPSTTALTDVKTQADGSWVGVDNAAVTACYNGFFYIEADDRTAGIRVKRAGHGLLEGTRVSVTGTISTNNAERYIDAVEIK